LTQAAWPKNTKHRNTKLKQKIARGAEFVGPKNNRPQKTMTENCNTWKITLSNLIKNFVINIQQLITPLRNNIFNKIQWSLQEIIGD